MADIWREEGFVLIVDPQSHVRPPKKRLDEWCAVVDLHLGFDQAFPGWKQMPTIPFIRRMGWYSLSQTVAGHVSSLNH